eukprot:GHVR01104769.1.p1 GENE.GHVR01104769.1~~GHVR01104769.1.p1  ORF type:complete len:361 (+),score=29.09 GHVR01104769.1:551-1633(+)
MGFRIHRGAWQFKDSQNRYVTKYKLDTDGELKETDANGNITTDAYLRTVPSEYLTQTEGDGRYLQLSGGTITGNMNFQGYLFLQNEASNDSLKKSNSFINPRDPWNNFRLKDAHGQMYFDSGAYHFRTSSSSEHALWTDSLLQIKTGNLELDNGNVYANRYYDKQDTSYYLDPSGTSYLNDVRTNVIYDRNNTNYYLHLDSSSHLNTVYAFRYYDKDNGSYYLEPANTSRLVGINADEYVQAGHGKPRNNLGSPTVTEMALFESQFTCKTDLSNSYDDMSDLTFWVEQNQGDAWREITDYDDNRKRQFLRTNNSNVQIPNRAYKFRVEFNARHYTFANAIYFYWSSESHNSQVHIWKKKM